MNSLTQFPLESLSNRELQVLSALSQGASRSEVAEKLCIAVATYDGYRKSIRQKLRIKNSLEWGQVLMQFLSKMEDNVDISLKSGMKQNL